jgi:hypothetical protein
MFILEDAADVADFPRILAVRNLLAQEGQRTVLSQVEFLLRLSRQGSP